ncbi:MAG: DUF1538 domain-containing protein [Woeseiaceae bacterium]
MDLIVAFGGIIGATILDVLPVAAFMLFFYRVVLGRQLVNPRQLAVGFCFMVVGLGIFLLGLEQALFPVGRRMVEQLTSISLTVEAQSHWYGYYLIYAFAFCIAFGAAIAEPALLAIALKVDDISGGAIHPWGLRVAAALGVGTGVTLGCIRIVTGIPLFWCIGAGYLVIILQTLFAPKVIVPLAYDSGGVSTSAVTVPVVTALGLGLAQYVPGRSELLDGFGLIALACVFPVITVLAYAQVTSYLEKRSLRVAAGKRQDSASKEN